MNETQVILLNTNYDDPNHELLYKCPKCDRCFRNVGPLKCHFGKAHRDSEPFVCIIDSSLSCEICHKTFSQRCDLTTHYRRSHHKNKLNSYLKVLYKCEICGNEFLCKSELDNHYHRHKERNKDSLRCDVCNALFYNTELFETHCKTHINTKSDFDKHFQCEICFKKFAKKSALRMHSYIHTKQKRYHCVVCGKSFNLRGNLLAHCLIHTKEKNFGCDVCGKQFSRKNVLKIHYRIHSKEKPYVCQECNRSFSQLGGLQSHYFTHTQEKPFQCEICSKGFILKSKLNQHYMMHKQT